MCLEGTGVPFIELGVMNSHKTGPRLTPTEREEIVAAYVAGQRVKSLAFQYGISGPAVSSLLKYRKIVRHGSISTDHPTYVNSAQAGKILGVSQAMALFLARQGSLTNQVPEHSDRPWNEPYIFLRSEVEALRETRPRLPRLPPRPHLAATDLAYMACFIDGEGTICITNPSSRNGASFGLLICVTNTHRGAIDWCLECFGGAINTRHGNHPVYRPCHIWKTTGARAAAVLQQLLPYFKIKKEQALIGLAFQERLEAYNGHKHKQVSPEERQYRAECQKRLSDLNLRGPR